MKGSLRNKPFFHIDQSDKLFTDKSSSLFKADFGKRMLEEKDNLLIKAVTDYLKHEPTAEDWKLIDKVIEQGKQRDYLRYNRKTFGYISMSIKPQGVTIEFTPYENPEMDRKINKQQDTPPVETLSDKIQEHIKTVDNKMGGYLSKEYVIRILQEIKEHAEKM